MDALIRRARSLAVMPLLAAALMLAGCGTYGMPAQQISYTPASYVYQGHCMWVNDPVEITYERAAGLCPAGYPVMQMPLWYHEQYAAYYDGYGYTHYFPGSYRKRYVYVVVHNFEQSYSGQIARAEQQALWRGSNGQVVSGKYVDSGKALFGSGNARSAGFASGSARQVADKSYSAVGNGKSGAGSNSGSSGRYGTVNGSSSGASGSGAGSGRYGTSNGSGSSGGSSGRYGTSGGGYSGRSGGGFGGFSSGSGRSGGGSFGRGR
jgi:hypothetical protein